MFETHHLMIDAEDDILAISSTETRYNIQLSSTDLLSCHRMNQVFMCESFGVMSKRFNDTCLGVLYMQWFELVRGLCKFRVVPLKEQVYQVRKGQYLVYSPEASIVQCLVDRFKVERYKSDDFNSFLMHLFFWRTSNLEWIFVRCGLYSKEVGTVACNFCGQALTIKVLPTVLSWSVGYCN